MSSITNSPRFQARQTSSAPSATSTAKCTWFGHCLGDKCTNENDCDNDWVCSNKICVPCCGTSSPSISPSATSSPSSMGKAGTGLNTTAAIGIGVGIVAFLILCVCAGFWVWIRRRKRRGPFEAPNTFVTQSGPGGASSSTVASDQKRLVETARYAAELPCSARKAELSSVELVELQGSPVPNKQSEGDDASGILSGGQQSPAQASTPRPQRYRFEEYTISPDERSPGLWTFSPIADGSRPYTPAPSMSTASDRRALESTLSASDTLWEPDQTSSLQSYRTSQIPSQPSSVTLTPNWHSPSRSTLPPASPHLSVRQQPDCGVCRSPRGRSEPEDDSAVAASTDPNEPYTLFRWPSDRLRPARYTPR